MIHDYKTIELFGKTLFTWVSLETPLVGEFPIPENQACFAYIWEAESGVLSVDPGHMILSKCNYYAADQIAHQDRGKVSSLIVHFHKDVLKKVYENELPPFIKPLEEPSFQYYVQKAASELVKGYFSGLLPHFKHQNLIQEDMLVLKLKEIIMLLAQTKDSPQIIEIVRSLFTERTFTFKEIIEANICNPLSIEQLAMLTNNSVSTFKREFKKIYHTTPNAYFIEKRLEKVAEKLLISDESISNIGYDCGFNSATHLSRVFKAKYGLSPSEYRMSLSVQ